LLFTGLLIYAFFIYHYDRIAKKGSLRTSEKCIDHEYQPDNAFETNIPVPEPVSPPKNAQTNDYFFNNVLITPPPSNIYNTGSHHSNPFGSMTSVTSTNDYGQRHIRPNIVKARISSTSSYSRFYHSPEPDDGRSQSDGLSSTAAGQETRRSYPHPTSPRSSLHSLLLPPSESLANNDYTVSRQSLSDEQAKMYWQGQRTYWPASIKLLNNKGW
jgi:hypothetical protein